MSQLTWSDSKVIVCAGTGGVGKTTLSAVLGIQAARQGKRVLVLTVDPARRLADALGLSSKTDEQRVSGIGPGELTAAMIDAKSVFIDFVRKASSDSLMAEKLIGNRLFGELMSSLSGSQEFTALEKLLSAVESQKYDLIILDTPPSQHAIDFLRAPERIFALFQSSITQWFIDSKKKNVLHQIISRGTKTVLNLLESVTGPGFLGELSDFFLAAANIQGVVAARSIQVHKLLADPATAFVLVTAFDEAKLREAFDFATDLNRSGHQLKAVIVNRSLPKWLVQEKEGLQISSGDPLLQDFVESYNKLSQYYSEKERSFQAMLVRLHKQVRILHLPEEKSSIEGLDGLVLLSEKLQERFP